MIELFDLQSNFLGVEDLGGGIFRCKDALPKTTIYYYTKIGVLAGEPNDYLVVSKNLADDNFAKLLLASVEMKGDELGLHIISSPPNKYGFTQIVVAPVEYHSYFKGRLDQKRSNLFLCTPSFTCEFSGKETVEEFSIIRRDIVPSLNWQREISPKALLYFDNPKTRAGSGARDVYVKQSVAQREIDLLSGVENGFIEISNYKGEVIEILSPNDMKYILINDRNDSTRRIVSRDELRRYVESFLVK